MIEGRHTGEGDSPDGAWLWYTAHLAGVAVPLPAWFCPNGGSPKVIGDGWIRIRSPQ